MDTAAASRVTPGIPGNFEKTGTFPWAKEHARSVGMAEQCLEGSFLPDRETLVSFLVNALYLFGDQGIAAYGGLPEGVEAELARLGHKVAHGRYLRAGRETRDAGMPHRAGTLPQGLREGARDRALFLAQTFGRGGDAEIMETLRAMRRTVRPGGLVCFHIFDRDRAWSLVGKKSVRMGGENGGEKADVRLGFEPETGRITARVSRPNDPVPERPDATPGKLGFAPGNLGFAALKTWNLGEIRSLLRTAGLQLERAYGDWDGGSPESSGAATGRLIVVAARPRVARSRATPAVER
jgi:hypothetical protein